MGLRISYVGFIRKFINDDILVSMCELGNQIVRPELSVKYKTGKEFWQAQGITHVSIDKNGLDGAIKLDLSTEIKILNDSFDIVTDIGVSCYIKNYRQCHLNMLAFCKVGGHTIHILPEAGSKWTGRWYANSTTANSIAIGSKSEVVENKKISGEYGYLRAIAIKKG